MIVSRWATKKVSPLMTNPPLSSRPSELIAASISASLLTDAVIDSTFNERAERAPAKVDAVALHRRRVEHGHLSVGLKIHCLGDGSQFSTLVEGLGGAQKILDVN